MLWQTLPHMNTRAITAVIIRLFAFYLIFLFLLTLPQWAGIIAKAPLFAPDGTMEEAELMYSAARFQMFFMFLAYVPLPVLMFIKADKLSRFLVKDDAKEIALPAAPASHLLACAYRCLGIYAIITWAPGLIQTILQNFIYAMQLYDATFQGRLFAIWPELISPVAGTFIGAWLAFASKGKWPYRDLDAAPPRDA